MGSAAPGAPVPPQPSWAAPMLWCRHASTFTACMQMPTLSGSVAWNISSATLHGTARRNAQCTRPTALHWKGVLKHNEAERCVSPALRQRLLWLPHTLRADCSQHEVHISDYLSSNAGSEECFGYLTSGSPGRLARTPFGAATAFLCSLTSAYSRAVVYCIHIALVSQDHLWRQQQVEGCLVDHLICAVRAEAPA